MLPPDHHVFQPDVIFGDRDVPPEIVSGSACLPTYFKCRSHIANMSVHVCSDAIVSYTARSGNANP